MPLIPQGYVAANILKTADPDSTFRVTDPEQWVIKQAWDWVGGEEAWEILLFQLPRTQRILPCYISAVCDDFVIEQLGEAGTGDELEVQVWLFEIYSGYDPRSVTYASIGPWYHWLYRTTVWSFSFQDAGQPIQHSFSWPLRAEAWHHGGYAFAFGLYPGYSVFDWRAQARISAVTVYGQPPGVIGSGRPRTVPFA